MIKYKVACGWNFELISESEFQIEGNVIIKSGSEEFRSNMIWDKRTGYPMGMDKYPTRYYMRLINA